MRTFRSEVFFFHVVIEFFYFNGCNRWSYKSESSVNPHHIQRLQSSYIIHTRRRRTDLIATPTGRYGRRGKWVPVCRGEKMLMCVWSTGRWEGSPQISTISKSAQACRAVSLVPLCCPPWPLTSLWKRDEWQGHRFSWIFTVSVFVLLGLLACC